jgi:hypothetical protein
LCGANRPCTLLALQGTLQTRLAKTYGIALAFPFAKFLVHFLLEASSMNSQSQAVRETGRERAFDSYFWGDSVTLKVLLIATVLMWTLGVLNAVARWLTH